jgi:hypothetical protein
MQGRVRRRAGLTEQVVDEGPFVSFTDLTIGILFLFLILVAALMLMHQDAVQKDQAEAQQMSGQIQRMSEQVQQMSGRMKQMSERSQTMQARLKSAAKLDADHPPFRLAIVYNSFQRAAGARDWTFSRTVQIFRAPNDLCLSNVILRSNLSLAWKPPVKAENIPTAGDQTYVRMGAPCTLSAQGERWNLPSETGGVNRTAPNLYSGVSILHKAGGNELLEIQYRVLGIYDAHFR